MTEEELKRQAQETSRQAKQTIQPQENGEEREHLEKSNLNEIHTQRSNEVVEDRVEMNEAEEHERYLRLCRGEQLLVRLKT